MELFTPVLPVLHVAQVVLPYDPDNAPALNAPAAGEVSFVTYIGLGIACFAFLILAVLLLRRRVHHRR